MKNSTFFAILATIATTAVAEHSAVHDAGLQERTIDNTCDEQQKSMIIEAMKKCQADAPMAQKAAQGGDKNIFKLFFKTDDQKARQKVAQVFEGVAAECKLGAEGKIQIACTPASNPGCSGGKTNAFATLNGLDATFCPGFFKTGEKGSCGGYPRANILMHEFFHSKLGGGSTDIAKVYGLRGISKLPSSQNLAHADTYAYFANSISMKCSAKDLEKGGLVPSGGLGNAPPMNPVQPGPNNGPPMNPARPGPINGPPTNSVSSGSTKKPLPSFGKPGSPSKSPKNLGKP